MHFSSGPPPHPREGLLRWPEREPVVPATKMLVDVIDFVLWGLTWEAQRVGRKEYR